jgi:hypothetical protein
MHDGHGVAESPSTDDCSIRSTCGGPMPALVALLTNVGVLTEASTLVPDLNPGQLTTGPLEHPLRRLLPPDSPPPRA